MFLAISGILLFALVSVLEVRLLWSFLGLAQKLYIWYIVRVFDPRVEFFPCTSLLICHNIYMTMYWLITVL